MSHTTAIKSSQGAPEPPAIIEFETPQLPTIYVVLEWENGGPRKMARAHLKYQRGYVSLKWRDGEKVCTFYLGKAPRKSPTAPDGER